MSSSQLKDPVQSTEPQLSVDLHNNSASDTDQNTILSGIYSLLASVHDTGEYFHFDNPLSHLPDLNSPKFTVSPFTNSHHHLVRNAYGDDTAQLGMSTPSTATATLVPQHPHYGYSHHQNYQPTGSNYGTKVSSSGGRVGLANPASSSSSHVGTFLSNAPNSPYSTKLEPPISSTMSVQHAAPMMQSKKRQRSKEPDWETFYKNGLPKEVIVIDDSPPPPTRIPDSAESPIPMKRSNRPAATSTTKHAAKKRKRDDGELAYDPIYPQTNSNTPHKNDSASTISTDRTTSAIHTTAATSLGSQYSHNADNHRTAGTYEVDPQVGSNKRKRVATRQHILNEAKRKEIETHGDAFSNYKAPPRPPIKCADVEVPVKQDVSLNTPIQQVDINQCCRSRILATAKLMTTTDTISSFQTVT